MPFDESDSQVKVNCVFVGEGFLVWSNKLVLSCPCGVDAERAAALAMAAEMIPWSEWFENSPGICQ